MTTQFILFAGRTFHVMLGNDFAHIASPDAAPGEWEGGNLFDVETPAIFRKLVFGGDE